MRAKKMRSPQGMILAVVCLLLLGISSMTYHAFALCQLEVAMTHNLQQSLERG